MDSLTDIARHIAKIASSTDPCHGYDHAERVTQYAKIIAEEMGIDVDVEALEIAALMHDIARGLPEDHAEASAEIAYHVLLEHGASIDLAKKVKRIIACHSYSAHSKGRACTDIEGIVLSDADKIDAIGAIGIARVFIYSGAHGRSIPESLEHIRRKILTLGKHVRTKVGERLAAERIHRVETFLNWIREELSAGRQSAKLSSSIGTKGPAHHPS